MQCRHPVVSGVKAFDCHADTVAKGQVFSSVQSSLYIRPFVCTENPVGEMRPAGELREFDLKSFSDTPEAIKVKVRTATLTRPGILYQLFHWNGSKKVIHGWILTTGHEDHKLIFKIPRTHSRVNHRILNAVEPVITGPDR